MRYLAMALLALLTMLWSVDPVPAHDWYDADCCSRHDCEPVAAISFVADNPGTLPVMIVTTSLGTKPVTPSTRIRQSKDGRMHGCIFMGSLICLYMPPGN